MEMSQPNWWDEFKKWEKDFREPELGEYALSEMKQKLEKGKRSKYYRILEDQVLKNCFFAITYQKEKDSNNNLRERYGPKFIKELEKQIKKINELRDFIVEYPEIPEYGFKYNKDLHEKELFFYSRKNSPPPLSFKF